MNLKKDQVQVQVLISAVSASTAPSWMPRQSVSRGFVTFRASVLLGAIGRRVGAVQSSYRAAFVLVTTLLLGVPAADAGPRVPSVEPGVEPRREEAPRLVAGHGAIEQTIGPSFARSGQNAPSVNDDRATAHQDASVTAAVLANDSPGGAALDSSSVQIESAPGHGSAVVSMSDGSITYTPDAGFTGKDRLTYSVADTNGDRSEVATLTVTVLPDPYGSGRALALDGTDDLVAVPDHPAINTVGPYEGRTVELWFKAADVDAPTEQVLFEEGGEQTGLNIYLKNGTLYVGTWLNGAYSQWLTTDRVETGQWHHVALVFDGADGTLRGVLDGTTFGSGAASSSFGSHAHGTAIGAVHVEAQFDGHVFREEGKYFEGDIDQVRLWDGALTQAQLRRRSRRTIDRTAAAADSLIAAYRFDRGAGTVAFDYVTAHGRRINGTLTGDPQWRAGSGAPLGQRSRVLTSGSATLGPSGGTISVDDASTSGSGAVQIYSYGRTDGAVYYDPEPGEDFAAGDDVVKRLPVVWGLATVGTASTGAVTIDYSNVEGLQDPENARLLRRDGPGDSWDGVTSDFTWDTANQTFTIGHYPGAGQYAIGEQLRAPTAEGDRDTTAENRPLRARAPGVLENDSDPYGDPLDASLQGQPADGQVTTFAANGSYTFDPSGAFDALAAGEKETETVQYEVTNTTKGTAATAEVRITVEGRNDAPTATSDRDTTAAAEILRVGPPGLLANDSDVDGDTMIALVTRPPANGEVEVSPDGSFRYDPNGAFRGLQAGERDSVTFGYEAVDGNGARDTSTVMIEITPPVLLIDGLSAQARSTAVTVQWSPSSVEDFAAYQVYRSASDTLPDGPASDTIRSRATTSHVASGLSTRTVYTFFVTVQDTAGNEGPASTVRAVPRPPTLSWTGSVSFGDVTKTSGYRMVGLPGKTGGAPIDSTLSGSGGNDWTAYAAPGITSPDGLVAYSEAPDALRFRQGRGHWVLSKSDWAPSGSSASVPLSDTLTTAVPVPEGWSIITSPFPVPVAWHRITRATPGLDSTRALWGFDGQYRERTHLRPYHGYYLFNDPTSPIDSLHIPYPRGTTHSPSGPAAATVTDMPSGADGLVLVARAGETSSRMQLQVASSAEANGDAREHFAPPPLGTEAWVAARSPAGSGAYPWLKRAVRAPQGDGVTSVPVRVSGPPAVTATVSVENLDHVGPRAIYLADPQTEQVVDLRQGPGTLHLAGAEAMRQGRTVEIWVGPRDALEERRSAFAPEKLALRPPAPNPTTTSARLQYTIPERRGSMHAELVIYDVLGREVQRLVDTEKSPGRYVEHWQGRNGDGKRLASGVYLCRFVADGDVVETRKISLVR